MSDFLSKPVRKDGSTATVVLVVNNTLYSANIGDSKVMINKFIQHKYAKEFLN
jgi:hypothetical protein